MQRQLAEGMLKMIAILMLVACAAIALILSLFAVVLRPLYRPHGDASPSTELLSLIVEVCCKAST